MKKVVVDKTNKNVLTVASSMGCRTYNGWDVNFDFKQELARAMAGKTPQISANQKDGRGNICPVTIIMPTLAMQTKQEMLARYGEDEWDNLTDVAKAAHFLHKLDRKIHEAKDMLIERFEWIASQSPASAKFMYENNVMAGYIPEEGIRSALKHGTLAIGQLGLAETLQILIGTDHTTPEGMELAKEIEALFKKRCAEFKHEYSLNFGVYYTPKHNF